VAIVTGAGAGLGRAEALALAAAGAELVLNDVASSDEVVDEIKAAGGRVTLVPGDVGDSAVARRLVETAVGLGGLDIVVNNAGIVRDRMLFSLTDEDWDDVVRVHLRGHFLLSRNAGAYWRQKAKADGGQVYGRLVNTTSEAWLFGAVAQANYAAAKAGIVALTVSAARGMGRYGVRANAICPRARTAMTAEAFGDAPHEGVDPLSVDHVAPLVAYLASPAAEGINGQVFVVRGGFVALLAPPSVVEQFDAPDELWTVDGLAETLGGYFSKRGPEPFFASTEVGELEKGRPL
jgi:3-oxoacyl-[acyl-carrier protein] reductase